MSYIKKGIRSDGQKLVARTVSVFIGIEYIIMSIAPYSYGIHVDLMHVAGDIGTHSPLYQISK